MADNILVTPGVGASIAADEITTRNSGTVPAELAQRVKVGWGIDGTFNDTNAASPLPVTSVVTSLPALAAGANVIGAVTQSGTWTVAGSGTFAISAASLPLPTGAATETSLAKLTIAQGATTSGQTGALIQGSVTTAAPSYTTGQVAPLSLDASGQLRITGTVTAGGLNQGSTTSGQQGSLQMGAVTTAAPSYTTAQTSPLSLTAGGLLRVDGSGVTQTISGSLTTVSTVTNLSQFGGAAINLGAGAVSTGTLRVTQASDSPVVAAMGSISDSAWASGNGTQIALLKTIAGGVLDTTTVSPVKIDQTTDGTTNKVAVGNSPAGNTAKSYTGMFIVAGAVTTRPANVTAYTALDSISNNATAGSVTATSSNNLSDTNDHPIDLVEILLDTTDTAPGVAGTQIRIHLFNADPTASSGVVGGDNAAYSNKRNGWLGSFSGTMRPFSDGSRGVLIPDEGTLRAIAPVTGAKNLYYQLQTIGAFAPSANSTTFTPTFKGFQARGA